MSDQGTGPGDQQSDPTRGAAHSRGAGGPLLGGAGARWRGVIIVAVAVVIGVLLLPSATRAPLSVAGSSFASTSTSQPPTTSPSSASTTTTTPLPSPVEVHVLVANATTINGVAGDVTTFLGAKGFSTLTATNATDKLAATEIYAIGGATAAAGEVAAALSLPAADIQPATMPVPVPSDAGATVVVIAGPDLAARFVPKTTSTTAAPG